VRALRVIPINKFVLSIPLNFPRIHKHTHNHIVLKLMTMCEEDNESNEKINFMKMLNNKFTLSLLIRGRELRTFRVKLTLNFLLYYQEFHNLLLSNNFLHAFAI
jgi:hypothetical protein